MNKIYSSILLALMALASACSNETSINEDDASEVIEQHLELEPEYETTIFRFGEIKLRANKDRQVLNKYRQLESQGLIEMTLDEQKKVFLSKDTTFVYQIRLTEKAAPLVLEQGKDRATVKALNYILDEDKPVNFVKSNNKTAKATVSLKKAETEFYPFLNKDSNSDFITKTYKLRLKKDKGWEVE
ncbi:hypothetical protein [Daejeonella lutea]|uniref:Uncharacterized protein n=1 Tax=Daejeonella lutea TaxID=572036 RepID=A0A1T5CT40_9SPHI|nr:hypothetical protein [Daejeonella lutea]SKB62678.1 hypothetical protein SAMN05661099_1853 [Daejeonella lutea]